VAALAAVIIRTLQSNGVVACGKHFPGHGDTSVDSHEVLPVVEHERRRLDAVEFVPFRRAVTERVATIMTAHVLVPALDDARIASLSPAVIGGVLKGTLGFDGVVISDDLGMKAVSAALPLADAAVGAIAAGCDAVLLCNSSPHEQADAIEALIRAAETGVVPAARIDDAFARQRRVKERFADSFRQPPAQALDLVGCAQHQDVAREMATWR
jgi:beta-N-acetylhexosaminidase